jgi:three-Cys-motif partner protein
VTDAVTPSPYDDGLYLNEVGVWVEDKHRLVELYEALFSTGMKFKWDVRVCIELFAGPGLLRVRETNRLLWGSPIRSLAVKDPFDKYIFCDANGEALNALRQRVARMFPSIDVSFVEGDCNGNVEQIKELIPVGSKSRKVLSFCFVDPYDLSVRFSTIKSLSERYMDFLVLLALNMDANRNLQPYLNPANRKLDEFLGLPDWRERWERRSPATMTFPQFLGEMYAAQMETLDYLPLPFHRMKQIRSDVRNLPLYHLALFSRKRLAYDYWEEVLKYSSPQSSFGW